MTRLVVFPDDILMSAKTFLASCSCGCHRWSDLEYIVSTASMCWYCLGKMTFGLAELSPIEARVMSQPWASVGRKQFLFKCTIH